MVAKHISCSKFFMSGWLRSQQLTQVVVSALYSDTSRRARSTWVSYYEWRICRQRCCAFFWTNKKFLNSLWSWDSSQDTWFELSQALAAKSAYSATRCWPWCRADFSQCLYRWGRLQTKHKWIYNSSFKALKKYGRRSGWTRRQRKSWTT